MNAIEKMEAYLKDLEKMNTEELNTLKNDYEAFSIAYDLSDQLEEITVDFVIFEEFNHLLNKPKKDTNNFSNINFNKPFRDVVNKQRENNVLAA